ncbi:hypothetical protein BIFPSEUDO_03144 [Bifidobacterium pseudocatenulatum DSM 20438 = JCM 1200 = LMG 10505]|uniref:Uncharacterized protein n=1 Tax=Bifidobacterium pseudocatenulatum DSM 20438 = JCM 1200 = LMG 10505 TaxID=547043 RepID=C0BSM6_BIFPS|nr:hypothetical protein BIFPSEUDO_03144 [Bifidobacterium pseudocatenulatum DSM 20438 = JCM 1200 = LMG 10505]
MRCCDPSSHGKSLVSSLILWFYFYSFLSCFLFDYWDLVIDIEF